MTVETRKIGKNILENLTTGMYTDSRSIYREYIQNAADAIDDAINKNLLKIEDAWINIDINDGKRQIIIEDNATGISKEKVGILLGDIAASIKDKDTNKGFRGIGRLGGLAYCNKLIFETSAYGENVKTTMIWDAKLLQDILNDSLDKSDALSVVEKMVSMEESKEEENKHYFKVKLLDVKKSNNQLLKVNEIREYLGMVAPVPFEKTKFYVCSDIYKFIQEKGYKLDEYNIVINTEKLYKTYQMSLLEANEKKPYDDITGVAFKEIFNKNEELLGWCWVGLHRFDKCIPEKNNPQRGMRLKKHNIEFGDSNTLNNLHRESRGNGYFIGEVHAVHPDLIPNARRDYFNENETLNIFEHELKEYFYYFNRNYHIANDAKNDYKKINKYSELKNNYEKTKQKGFVSTIEAIKKKDELEQAKKNAENAVKNLEKIKQKSQNDKIVAKIHKSIEKEYKKVDPIKIKSKAQNTDEDILSIEEEKPVKNFRAFSLNKLNKADRKLIGEIFIIIQEALDPETAENVIRKIEEKYS